MRAPTRSLRTVVEVLVALGIIAGSFVGVDRYFAHKSDLMALAGEVGGLAKQVQKGQLKSDVRALKQERAQLRAAEERGARPTPYERERLKEIETQITESEAELKK